MKSAIARSASRSRGMVRRMVNTLRVYPIWEEHQIREHLNCDEFVQFEKRESEAHMTLEERVRRFGDRRSKYAAAVRTGYGGKAKKRQRTRNFAGDVIQQNERIRNNNGMPEFLLHWMFYRISDPAEKQFM